MAAEVAQAGGRLRVGRFQSARGHPSPSVDQGVLADLAVITVSASGCGNEELGIDAIGTFYPKRSSPEKRRIKLASHLGTLAFSG